VTEPKTWLESEIVDLIAGELKDYRHDCSIRRRQYTHHEAAELVYVLLNDRGLIEHSP